MRPVQSWTPKISFRAAFPLLVLTLSSCASVGNFILTGHWEEPVVEEATPPPSVKEEPAPEQAPPKTASTHADKPSEAPKRQELPVDTIFSRGSWFFLRTPRVLYSWTGAGAQFRLFALDLHANANCWGSQRADRPVAEHCPDTDGPASSTSRANGQQVESVFAGIEKAPWRKTQVGAPLNEGSYDLPESSGGENGSVSLECSADKITIRTPHAQQGLVFTVNPASADFLVQGEPPDLFDGCTEANHILPVVDDLGVRFGQKKCGILRRQGAGGPFLTVDKVELEFSTTSKAPDIAKARVQSAELRKQAAENKAQLTVDISGDATHTLASAMMKRSDGAELSMVEGVKTIEDVHHKCRGTIDKMDATWVRTAKQVCGALVQIK